MFRCCFLFIFLIAATLHAQHPFYYHIGADKGLPSNEVYEITQDKKGFLWIGCDAGLYRYDGFVFREYTCNRKNSKAISTLKIDDKGNLWCRNFTGQIFCVAGDSLRLMFESEPAGRDLNYTIGSGGDIYYSDGLKIFWHQTSSGKTKVYTHSQSADAVYGIASMTTFNGRVFFWESGKGILSVPEKKPDERITIVYTNKDVSSGGMFYHTPDHCGIVVNNRSLNLFTDFKLDQAAAVKKKEWKGCAAANRLYYVTNTKGNFKWICTPSGAFPDTLAVSEFPEAPPLFPGKNVSCVFTDQEGMTWVSTLENGLFVIPDLRVQRVQFSSNSKKEETVSAICYLNENKIALGTNAGNVYLHNTKETLQRLNPEIKDGKIITVKKIRSYKNKLYVSQGRFNVYSLSTGEISPFNLSNLRDFASYKDTLFFIHSRYAGRAILDEKKKSTKESLTLFPSSSGKSIAADTLNNTVYYALNTGLFSVQNGVIHELLLNNQKIFSNAIWYGSGCLWAGTNGGNLLQFKNGVLIRSFFGKNTGGIKLVEGNNKAVFAVSDKHIFKLDIETGEAEKWNHTHGLNAADVSALSVSENTVWLGTHNGYFFYPANMSSHNNVKPDIRLEQVKINGYPVAFGRTQKIDIPWKHNNIFFSFHAVSLKSRHDFRYATRIAELDSAWKYQPGNIAQVSYPSLPSGEFTFQVFAENAAGLRSDVVLLKLKVEEPVWKKAWFIVLVSLLGMGLTALVFIFRIRSLKKRARLQQRSILSQLTALKAQMNPHFMFNALNSIQDLIIQKDIKNSNLYLSKFSSLMRKILEASNDELITLENETEILELYLSLEKLRFGEEFTYTIKKGDVQDMNRIRIPSMLLQPFVENALKHGLLHKKGNKNLEIIFERTNELHCIIRDNGVGRAKSAEINARNPRQHRSFATSATQKRLHLINELREWNIHTETTDLSDENGVACGTVVHIHIPLMNSD